MRENIGWEKNNFKLFVTMILVFVWVLLAFADYLPKKNVKVEVKESTNH